MGLLVQSDSMAALKNVHLRFEILGKVQGVFFRKCTKNQADSLGLVGWVQNTARGSVIGVAEGEIDQIKQMKQWFEHDASKIPDGHKGHKIQVQKVEFDEHSIEKITFETFIIDRQMKYDDFTLSQK